MKKIFKLIVVLLTGVLLTACVHHHGYNRPYYGNPGYYPGYGNNYRNYYPGRYSSNRPRPPAYGYWRNNPPPRYPYNRGNNYYYQNNYYNRPPPRLNYGYGPRPGYSGHGNWRDHDHHDHHPNWNRQGRNENYGRPPDNHGQGWGNQGYDNSGRFAPYRGTPLNRGLFGRR